MARTKAKRKGQSISGYFKQVFSENPHWLDEKSNDIMLARYMKDHGLASPEDVPNRVRTGLSNIKSVLRKKARRAGRRGRPLVKANHGRPTLETLEEHIDDCLSLAKHLDREGLLNVIHLLRRARNRLVWKLGQP